MTPIEPLCYGFEDGYPGFTTWPNRKIATHQQAYDDWLYRAYVGGLRLMVMLAVNSEDMFGRGENDLSLLGRVAIRRCAPRPLHQRHGGAGVAGPRGLPHAGRWWTRARRPGKGWYRIVRDPDEAAAAIAGGRLAVVLGTELQHLFNCDSDRPACSRSAITEGLDRLEGMGVNYVFPIHHKVNQFGGPAQFNPLTNGPTYDCKETNEACSSVGLTATGRTPGRGADGAGHVDRHRAHVLEGLRRHPGRRRAVQLPGDGQPHPRLRHGPGARASTTARPSSGAASSTPAAWSA